MSEQERAALERQIREQVENEQRERERARKRDWYNRNKDHVRQYAKIRRLRKKLCGEVNEI